MPFSDVMVRRTPTLNAGRLRHKIKIVQPGTTQDSTGGMTTAYTTLYDNVWAAVTALNGDERFAASQFVSQVTHQVVMRYMAGVNAGQHVIFGNRRYQIEAVMNPDERPKSLVLMCIEINDSKGQQT